MQSSPLRKLAPYAVAIASTAIALLLTLWLEPIFSRTIAALFFLAVTITTSYGGIKPGLVAIVLSTLSLHYFFVSPRFSASVSSPEDILRLLIFIAVALVINILTSNLQRSKEKITQLNQQLLQDSDAQLQKALSERLQLEAERKQTETQLHLSQERLHHLLSASPAVIYSCKPTGDYGATFVGKNAKTMLDYESQDFLGNSSFWAERIHPEDAPRVFADLVHLFEEGHHIHEYRFQHQNGSYRWVRDECRLIRDEDGQPLEIVGYWIDISERKQAEVLLQEAKAELEVRVAERTAALAQQTQILQEAERRWRSLLENVQLAVVGLNCAGNVEYVNSFFLKMTGYSETEVMGKLWFTEFIPPGEIQKMRSMFQEILRHNFHPHYQNTILTKAGEERIMAWNNTLLRDQGGTVVGTMSIGEDITQRQIVDRMKNEFISIVSHELRTPLTAIRGSLGLMASGTLDSKPDKSKQLIHIAAEQSDRLVRLVNDILDLRRLESGKVSFTLKPCDASLLLVQAADAMRSHAEARQLSLQIEASIGQVLADTDAILQTLTNLLSNAIKFSLPHSTISLNATLEDTSVPNNAQPMVRFTIRDRGRGIPAEMVEHIFEPFQQVDASDSRDAGGTGLGLAICRKIVQQHGGQIWVESVLGQGSTFYFTLPYVCD